MNVENCPVFHRYFSSYLQGGFVMVGIVSAVLYREGSRR
jgi:hypothetical protein